MIEKPKKLVLDYNTNKINLLFQKTYCDNHLDVFLDEILSFLHVNLNSKNQENVLEKLEQVLGYLNTVFLSKKLTQIEKN